MKYPQSRWSRAANCAAAILILLSSLAAYLQAATGTLIDFPKDDSLPYDKFGVYIGIDKYVNLPESAQLSGCVADANAFKEAFSRLGVKRYALLTNDQATRQGIGHALSELVEQVKIAKTKTKEPITVVITYAGHGCRLKRLPTEDEPNTIDSSWVAEDSDVPGTHDVRGYEIQKIHTELAKLGAQVMIISDSCHSASLYRGDAFKQRTLQTEYDQEKSRGVSGYLKRLGPQDDLFPQYSIKWRDTPHNAAAGEDEPLPGFVFFSACGDNQSAYEAEDDQGKPCGRLSLVMRTLLARLGQETTYQELASQVAAQFDARWPGRQQVPEFHAAYGKADELFFRGGFPPPHATIVSNSINGRMLKLSMGSFLGVAPGSRFTFYKNLDDLSAHRDPITTGQVTSVDPTICQVKLDGDATVTVDFPAALDTVRISDFVLATEGDVPDFVMVKLRDLDKNHQIQLTDKTDKCSAVLRYDAGAKTINLYSPTALPPLDKPDSSVPTLRPPIACRGPDDAELIASNLLYAARIQRMMTLDHQDKDLLKSDIATDETPRSINGVRRLTDNQPFAVHVNNKSDDAKLYITILTLDNVGTLNILYPVAGQDAEPIDPGKSRDIKFDATIDDPKKLKRGDAEMSVLKVLATDQPMDLSALAVPPQTGAANVAGTRGAGDDNAVFDLMKDVLHGGEMTGQLSRGVPRAVISQKWATANLIFGVEPAETK